MVGLLLNDKFFTRIKLTLFVLLLQISYFLHRPKNNRHQRSGRECYKRKLHKTTQLEEVLVAALCGVSRVHEQHDPHKDGDDDPIEDDIKEEMNLRSHVDPPLPPGGCLVKAHEREIIRAEELEPLDPPHYRLQRGYALVGGDDEGVGGDCQDHGEELGTRQVVDEADSELLGNDVVRFFSVSPRNGGHTHFSSLFEYCPEGQKDSIGHDDSNYHAGFDG